MHTYRPHDNRYQTMTYRRCGRSGLKLPTISLGLWHNFGSVDVYDNARAIAEFAFDHGITHFDLANNYGPEPGSAELTFGRILRESLAPWRDELIISTKAGYGMWPGPYGDFGSRKYLIASCDQSLKRMGLDYVDIFYHHRPDPETPIEETMLALDHIVRSGRALYVGISNYGPEDTRRALAVLREHHTPFVIQQMCANMLNQTHIRNGLFGLLDDEGIGAIVFSPLAQGLLTDRYLDGVPADSRAAKGRFLKPQAITPQYLQTAAALRDVARQRGQTLAQLALAWLLAQRGVTSTLVGASRTSQLADVLDALKAPALADDELARIAAILG